MSVLFDNLERAVRAQLKGHDGDTVEMAGEQLLDMARGNDHVCELLLNDLDVKDMTVEKAEKQIKAWADEVHKKNRGNCVGVSPKKAEEILRKFYGLPEAVKEEKPAEIDPFAFL